LVVISFQYLSGARLLPYTLVHYIRYRTVQGLIIQGDTTYDLKISLSVLSDIILLLAGILSFFFLSRFLTLAQERFESIKLMNSIQNYYDKQLEHIIDFDKIYGQRHATEQSISVPSVIRNAVFVIGSLYIGGAIGVIFDGLFALLNVSILNSYFLERFLTLDILAFVLFLIVSVVMFFIFRWYYNFYLSRIQRNLSSSK
jgi:hypothetical protein